MYKKLFEKKDGRQLYLYGEKPITLHSAIPELPSVAKAQPHLRWHPLRGEWVAYASHRQNRTFLPPQQFNPLAPTTDPATPTELPSGQYDIAVFENRFPSLSLSVAEVPQVSAKSQPGTGVCEVVVFSQIAEDSLAALPTSHLRLLIDVWADRYHELGEKAEISYVMIFENRGKEVGVTLHHPHGQIYAYPFVPPIPQREQQEQSSYFAREGRSLLSAVIENEERENTRVIYRNDDVIAFVPVFARYPYEVWVAPRRQVASLPELSDSERRQMASALKTVLQKYDGLWNKPFPYLMVIHQKPTDKKAHPESHLWFEFSPALRSSDRLKYLAGTELGAGMFTNDSLPEEKAAELNAVEVPRE